MISTKNILTSALTLGALSLNAQVLISDADFSGTNACECATTFLDNSAPNFYDTGSNSANYSDNENEEITFCPDGNGSKMTLFVGNNAGFTWDVDPSDTLYVYDGPTTASPLIVAANSATHPGGMSAGLTTASWSNISGCLTVKFVSDAVDNGTGWEANIACNTPWQPMELHMEALIGVGEANGNGDMTDDFTNQAISGPLADTGYVNICLGDSIMFVNTTDYPYEPGAINGAASGGGYNQSNFGNHLTEWVFSDGSVATGDTAWFTPTARTGYFVSMKVTDNNLQYDQILSKIRVSTTPSFETCAAVDPDICLGQATFLIGGITAGDTAGVDATGSSFQIQGSFGAQTFLPDGSGQNYTTNINISGFPSGLTLQNAGDLERVCVSMEHSYLGDLEMMLTCPNGSSVMIFNSYTGTGLYAGGFGGGGTYLGGANDASSAVGVCEEYCFSGNAGSFPAWANGFNTVAATGPSVGNMVEPGTYNPEESFVTQLAGCPLNGAWTLTVRDNLGIDDGWICEWGIYFDASLNPNNETYAPTIVSEDWLSDPTILLGTNDTAVIVQPNVVGTYGYTFEVEDNFGCNYDTTITVEVIQGPSILPNDSTCGDDFQFSGTYVPSVGGVSGGNWFYDGPGNLTFSPNTTFINPTITPDENGEYNVYFTDNVCNDTVLATILFLDDPVATIYGEDTICQNDSAMFYTNLNYGEAAIWDGPTGMIVTSDSSVIGVNPGQYTVTTSNFCSTSTASMDLVVQSCSVPNVITPNDDGKNDTFYTRYADVHNDVNLTIYNRWGRVVYKTESYDNSWGGEKTNGKDLNSGVYYYVMTWNGNTKDEAGTITVFGK